MVHAAFILITAVVAAHFLIAAGAEGFVAGAGENNGADAVVVAGIGQRFDHLFHRVRPEGITHLRTVNGDFSDAVAGLVVEDIFEIA
ncbi:hypothetical protein D3C72_2320770 [compost metagenome]